MRFGGGEFSTGTTGNFQPELTLWSTSSLRPSSAGIEKAFVYSGDGSRDREGGRACPLTFGS
jgi:hypothetical protein